MNSLLDLYNKGNSYERNGKMQNMRERNYS